MGEAVSLRNTGKRVRDSRLTPTSPSLLMVGYYQVADSRIHIPVREISSISPTTKLTKRIKMTDQDKVDKVKKILILAESWIKEQVLTESSIHLAALKDIRRIVRQK